LPENENWEKANEGKDKCSNHDHLKIKSKIQPASSAALRDSIA